MKQKNFTFQSEDGTGIYVYHWSPEEGAALRGIVQIAHGMAETAARYDGFARALTEAGYVVYANDHRGHGRTAGIIEKVGYLADREGFRWLVEDVHKLSCIIQSENPGLPLFLFGHSMGSFVSQRYIMLYGKELKGVILSGSDGSRQGPLLAGGRWMAQQEIKKKGRKAQSERMNQMSFGSYNKAFRPNRTEFDWLSRDAEEVDKYIADPFCGNVFSCGFFDDFLAGMQQLHNRKELLRIPKELPIYIFSGDKDPVGKNGKGVARLLNKYRGLNIHDVSMKLYKEGRHEMLHEINRDEVVRDVIHWLKKHDDGLCQTEGATASQLP
jgi:alpha-beta hydrolase superfamily lysophospholipase